MRRERWSITRRAATATFVVLLLAIPVGLLTSVPPSLIAIVVGVAGIVMGVAAFVGPRRLRRTAGVGAQGFLIAAAILGVIHVTGLLEPMYRREGWLLLELDAVVSPMQVQPEEILEYSLSTTNDGPRAARGRVFFVDGERRMGVLMYGRLPDLRGDRFLLDGPAVAEILSPTGERRAPLVIYAHPGLPELNPMQWEWSTTYTPGWKIVAALIASDEGELAIGETMTLTFRAVVPVDHPPGRIYLEHSALSYRDPQWATYYVHDRRFKFEESVTVLPPPG